MPEPTRPTPTVPEAVPVVELTVEELQAIYCIADRFEADPQPRPIREVLREHPIRWWRRLLRELLKVECDARRDREDEPHRADYEADFPWAGAILRELFPDDPSPYPAIPGYVFREVLGQGGMGTVYLVWDEKLGREVALKIPSGGAHPRFQSEMRSLARLDHPHIVPVYDAGEHEGLPYFTMKLITGGNLSQHGGHYRSRPREAAELLVKIARAIHHAHERGVIHRDLKPSNVLLDGNGAPVVCDFGLARKVHPTQPPTAAVAGTAAYMSPEQAEGRQDLTPAVDVYGLGAILYELLTNRPPFDGDALVVLERVRNAEPVSPRSLNRGCPKELETICLKCLEKNPARRYASAKELADDLQRYLDHEPILAKPPSAWERVGKWVRRRPAAAALALCAVAATVVVAFLVDRSTRAEGREFAARRQHALDLALHEGLNGNDQVASAHLAEAERLQASAEDLLLARGEIAAFRGDLVAAAEFLEQALRLPRAGVAARALLAIVSGELGDVQRYYEVVGGLRLALPKTGRDYLYLGLLRSYESPVAGIPLMVHALEECNTPVAYALLARARALAALATGDRDTIELAREDVKAARHFLRGSRDSSFVRAQMVFVNLVAAGIYEDLNASELRHAVLQEADQAMEGLDPGRHGPLAAIVRSTYLRERAEYLTDGAARQAAIRESRREAGTLATAVRRISASASGVVAVSYYEEGDFPKACEVLERCIEGGGDTFGHQVFRCYVLPEVRGPEAAYQACRDIKPPLGPLALFPQTVLRLLGDKKAAEEATQAIRTQVLQLNPPRPEWVDQVLAYNAGVLSAEDFLEAARKQKSRLALCEAHFFVGLTRLAERQPHLAKDHFRDAVKTRYFTTAEFHWSRAFLARLEKNPGWPGWIK